MLGKNKKSKEINIFENVPKLSDLLIPDELQETILCNNFYISKC